MASWFRQAVNHPYIADYEAKYQMDVDDDSREEVLCCPLPFLLQDLCLLVVINELDSYPTELLAALPYWLRYRILSCAPALDLARLECTPVASGVDTGELWNSRPKVEEQGGRYAQSASSTEGGNPFHLNVSYSHKQSLSYMLGVGFIIVGDHDLIKRITKDLVEVRSNDISVGNQSMIEIASALLTESKEKLTDPLNRLVSIEGSLVLSNLVTDHNCQNLMECNVKVWKRQPTALVTKYHTNISPYYSYYHVSNRDNIRLVPHRYMHFYDKLDPLELLLTLCTSCQLYPRGINIRINSMSRLFLRNLCAEQLCLDGNLSLPTKHTNFTSVINRFFKHVVTLRLQCDNYGHIGLVVSMIKAATVSGQASTLKHFFYDMPNLYMDIVGPLCALLSLPNFCLLMLKVSDMCSHTLSKLLQAFITAPCPHVQKLIIYVEHSPRFQPPLAENLVASLDMKGVSLPSCSLQHKVFKCFTNDSLVKGLHLLLQYPIIRLKDFTLFTSSKLFHLFAVHPDLQLTKLRIAVDRQNHQYKGTFQEDLASLFEINSLKKICIYGTWGTFTEVKHGIVFGLRRRSRYFPLRKLSLELGLRNFYDIEDFEMLCDAIFSLPQLENLKLVLGRGFGDLLSLNRFEDVLYKSWNHKAAGVRLKSIFFKTYETDLKQVSLVTQDLSFSLPPYDYDYDSYPDNDCYDSDDS